VSLTEVTSVSISISHQPTRRFPRLRNSLVETLRSDPDVAHFSLSPQVCNLQGATIADFLWK